MPRPLRLEFAQALYHVTSRGDRREPIFVDDRDRTEWLAVLNSAMSRAYASGRHSIQEIAEFHSVHVSTVSRAVARHEGSA